MHPEFSVVKQLIQTVIGGTFGVNEDLFNYVTITVNRMVYYHIIQCIILYSIFVCNMCYSELITK